MELGIGEKLISSTSIMYQVKIVPMYQVHVHLYHTVQYVNLTCIIYCTVQYHAVRPLVSCSMYRTVSYTLQYSIIYQVYSYHLLKGPCHKIFLYLFCFKRFNLLSHTNMQKRFRELFCFHEDILSQKQCCDTVS